ncbi:hypothetical protein [Corynebacterium freiburgense]|uniref:hypothetical protein n=1 Tax=Corynebacterium freiburgense TaxID=556548 RepID=UPI000417142B|nr:hypothetical protein [Corynebacterium freiburgense]WJZ03242.1 hypothetical protein CFREI_09825 [Corynebacterium freiburgense]
MLNFEQAKVMKKFDTAALKELAASGFDKALLAQQPIALEMVARLRRVHPEKSPEELVKFLNNTYLGTITVTGTGSGLASVVPNGVVQVPVALADFAAFLESSVLYVLALAEIYGVNVEDIERRRFLVLTALLGDSGTKTVTQALGKKTVPYWSKTIINKIPMEMITKANKLLGPRFITKYGSKQGMLVLGKQLPLALGAVVGAGGNATFGYMVIRSTKKLLDSPPENWDHLDSNDFDSVDEVIEVVVEDATEGN